MQGSSGAQNWNHGINKGQTIGPGGHESSTSASTQSKNSRPGYQGGNASTGYNNDGRNRRNFQDGSSQKVHNPAYQNYHHSEEYAGGQEGGWQQNYPYPQNLEYSSHHTGQRDQRFMDSKTGLRDNIHQGGYGAMNGPKGKQYGGPSQEYYEGQSHSGQNHNVRNSQSGGYREQNYQGEHLVRNQMTNPHQQMHERNPQYAGNSASQGTTQNYQNNSGYSSYKAGSVQPANNSANSMKQQQQQSFGRS